MSVGSELKHIDNSQITTTSTKPMLRVQVFLSDEELAPERPALISCYWGNLSFFN